MATQNRNEKCHCGSGRKFKKCHGLKSEEQRTARLLMLVVGGVLAAALVVAVTSFTPNANSGGVRVWSAEHGHYHDANGREIP